MNKKIITLTFMLLSITLLAQTQTKQIGTIQKRQVSENPIYQLFPTKNYWTFIKLDTRNGKMWQVHFSVENDINTEELDLNSLPLISKEKESSGRFTLYPTENMYNFLLLDQIEGTVVQVQWSIEATKRGIVSFIKPID